MIPVMRMTGDCSEEYNFYSLQYNVLILLHPSYAAFIIFTFTHNILQKNGKHQKADLQLVLRPSEMECLQERWSLPHWSLPCQGPEGCFPR